MEQKIITYQEWLWLARKLKKELAVVTAIVAVVISILVHLVMSAFSSIGGGRLYTMPEIENRIDEMAAENDVTIYPFRYKKIMAEIMATQDTTARNVEKVILKNINELKEMSK